MPGLSIAPEQARKFDLRPKVVTAALIGLKGRAAVFNVQRFVADYAEEPLMAVLPGALVYGVTIFALFGRRWLASLLRPT